MTAAVRAWAETVSESGVQSRVPRHKDAVSQPHLEVPERCRRGLGAGRVDSVEEGFGRSVHARDDVTCNAGRLSAAVLRLGLHLCSSGSARGEDTSYIRGQGCGACACACVCVWMGEWGPH